MASPFQQQSLIRKVIYLGVIIGLFSGSWVWRRYFLEPQANALAALEQNTGEVQLSDAAARLALTGTRGFVTCYLWMSAIEMQKKHQWNELEVEVRSLTTLQPHFLTPWLFQSWNLSYNVVAESDRVDDKYFYVSRGVELLGDGERQNRNNPDLRFNIGMYMQHKICQSDETNVMRSLFQMSAMQPNERDPNRFYVTGPGGRHTINMKEFEEFCKDHPQLVRRLQQGLPRETVQEETQQLKCPTPEAVVQFLADHRRLPSIYQDVEPAKDGSWQRNVALDKLRPPTVRFPLLPPPPGSLARPYLGDVDLARWQSVPFDDAALTYDQPLFDHHDAYTAARAWYSYSQEPIPPPNDTIPGRTKDVVDRIRQRPPKYIAAVIFRHYPARTQSYNAERLQQEGWFDGEGWEVPTWFGNRSVVIGQGPGQNSRTAWEDAFNLWKAHGEANHLVFHDTAAELNVMRQAKVAEDFLKEAKIDPGAMGQNLRRDAVPEDMREYYDAFIIMAAFRSSLNMTNFNHHYHRARVEQDQVTVTARKAFHRAKALHLNADDDDAIAEYEKPEAMQAWREQVMLGEGHKEFRRDSFLQEETCEVQLRYLSLVNKQLKPRINRLGDFLPLMPKTENVLTDWLITKGPFDVVDKDGQPLIPENVMNAVQSRRHRGQPNKTQTPSAPPEKGPQ